jgi:hypothetical protein
VFDKGEIIMKNVLTLFLILGILPLGLTYGANIDANGSANQDFTLSHVVARISTFTTKTLASTINNGNTIISKFRVANNTSDGFKVNVKSTNLGNMVPATTDDGEANIAYVLSAKKLRGELGDGMALESSIDLSTATGTDLIKLGASAEQTTASAVTYKLTVTVDAEDASLIKSVPVAVERSIELSKAIPSPNSPLSFFALRTYAIFASPSSVVAGTIFPKLVLLTFTLKPSDVLLATLNLLIIVFPLLMVEASVFVVKVLILATT